MAPYPALRTTPHARTPARPTTELEVGVPTKTKRALRTVRFATTHDCAKNLAILISLRSKALPTLKRSKKNPKTKNIWKNKKFGMLETSRTKDQDQHAASQFGLK